MHGLSLAARIVSGTLLTIGIVIGLTALTVLVVGALKLTVTPARAAPTEIITIIDVSDSISERDFAFEMEGLAAGVTDPRFLATLGDGIWMEVFTWSSRGIFDTIVPRILVRGPGEAGAIAQTLRAKSLGWVTRYSERYQSLTKSGGVGGSSREGMTDLSAAIDEAVRRSIMRVGARRVINVIADGPDNIPSEQHSGIEEARDRAAGLGYTINAVLFNEGLDDEDYYRERVITGMGAFVLAVETSAELPEALERKFWQDMISLRENTQ